MNSRRKGKAGELELAAFLRERGFAARRGRQFQGGGDSPDVVGIDGIHIECKRCETLNVYRAMQQAIADCGAGKVPVVMHRRNKCEWLAIMRLEDFLRLAEVDHGRAGGDRNDTDLAILGEIDQRVLAKRGRIDC